MASSSLPRGRIVKVLALGLTGAALFAYLEACFGAQPIFDDASAIETLPIPAAQRPDPKDLPAIAACTPRPVPKP